MSLFIAPLSLILSSRVLTNCLLDFNGYRSHTIDTHPTKNWADVTPLSNAGVSENTVSVATGSFLRCTFSAGFGDRYLLRNIVLIGMRAY